MTADPFELALTTKETAGPIRNFWPLYVHDVAAYERRRPNRHGVFLDTDDVSTIAEHALGNEAWWNHPDCLFPYLARVDGIPAGFNLIAAGPYVPTAGVDFVVHEFFVTHAFRGDGTATRLAKEGIARHRGAWEVATYPAAGRPIRFWRRTLADCATGGVVETLEDHPFGRRVVFRFRNDA